VRKINILKFFIIVLSVGPLFYSCISENEESLEIDCNLSDLSLQATDVTNASVANGGVGSITVNASGGREEYSYSIDGTNFVSGNTFSDLLADSYTITVRDANGMITVNVTNGEGNIEFSIDGTNFVSNNLFSGLAPDTYNVTARNTLFEAERETTVLNDVTLSGNIMPIISTYCALPGCHADAQIPNLNTNAQIIGSAARILSRTQARTMPPAGLPMPSNEEVEQILCWVNDGALDN